MTAIPQLDVPDIFVEDDEDGTETGPARRSQPAYGGASTHLSVDGHRGSVPGPTDTTSYDNGYQHPLSFPPSSQPTSSFSGTPAGGFSFELYEPDAPGQDHTQEQVSEEMGRRGSVAASPVDAQGILDDSIWVDSIRRSATKRRSGGGSLRY